MQTVREYFHKDPLRTIGVALTNHVTGKTMGLVDIHIRRLSKEQLENLVSILRAHFLERTDFPYDEAFDAVECLMGADAYVEMDANLKHYGREHAAEFINEGKVDVSLWTFSEKKGRWNHVCVEDEGSMDTLHKQVNRFYHP